MFSKETNTKALLHFNDKSSPLKDECGNTWTSVGTLSIKNANATSPTMGPSLYFDKETYLKLDNINTLIPEDETTDFTIECRIFIKNARDVQYQTSSQYLTLFQFYNANQSSTEDIYDSWVSLQLFYDKDYNYRRLIINYCGNDIETMNQNNCYWYGFGDNYPYHIVFTRYNSEYYVWINGIMADYKTWRFKPSGILYIGHCGKTNATTHNFYGYMNEFRVTKECVYKYTNANYRLGIYDYETNEFLKYSNSADANQDWRVFRFSPVLEFNEDDKTYYNWTNKIATDGDTTALLYEDLSKDVLNAGVNPDEFVFPSGTIDDYNQRGFTFAPVKNLGDKKALYHFKYNLDTEYTIYELVTEDLPKFTLTEEEIDAGVGEELLYPPETNNNQDYRVFKYHPVLNFKNDDKKFTHFYYNIESEYTTFDVIMEDIEQHQPSEEDEPIVFPSDTTDVIEYRGFGIYPLLITNETAKKYYYHYYNLQFAGGDIFTEVMKDIESWPINEFDEPINYPEVGDKTENYRAFKYLPLLEFKTANDKVYYHWPYNLEEGAEGYFDIKVKFDTERKFILIVNGHTVRIVELVPLQNFHAYVFSPNKINYNTSSKG